MNSLIKILLFTGGCIFLALAVAGIFLPLLPTTPFLLLSAACYVRSSQRLYNWLIWNKWLGKYIRNYREGKGITIQAKITGIVMLWITILYSVLFAAENLPVRAILLFVAIGVTAHLLHLKTYIDEKPLENEKSTESNLKEDI